MLPFAAQRSLNGPAAIVTHTLPGDLNGQAVMLDRLTRDTTGHGFVFIDTDRKATPRAPRANWVACYSLPTPYLARKAFRVRRLQIRLYHALVRQRAKTIARHARRHGCSSIVGCTGGDLIDLPAAVEAGRLTGLPTYLYYFDDYQMQWSILGGRWSQQVVAHLRDIAEPTVLSRCAGVIVPNETLAEDVARRTHAPVTVIRNPVDTEAYKSLREHTARPGSDRHRPLRIVYTGSVYEAQEDCLLRLSEAINLLQPEGLSVELHVYGTGPSREDSHDLLKAGICFHPPVTNAESALLQVQADLLFLPLSFTCNYPELIRTSAPGKFGEYLASGTPVLVHAPPDSFPTTFVERHACAAACSVPTSEALAATLKEMLTNPLACEAWRQRALNVAEGFSTTVNRQLLLNVITPRQAAAA